MPPSNPNLSESQPKTLWATPNPNFGSVATMRKVDAHAFGARVRERREELGLSQTKLGAESGYSQQRIGSIESGLVKRPERLAAQLADALSTTRDWLLWKEGPRAIGPQYLTTAELVEKYEALSAERKADISRAFENSRERRKSN